MSLTAATATLAAWEPRPARTLDAFQLIADGVTAVGGFGVAAISVVRDSMLVVEAVSGSEEARDQLRGTGTPVDDLLDEIALADDWGAFRFLPHDRIDPTSDNLGWVPDLVPLEVEDAWHPLDLLVAPLSDAHGRLTGLLSIDLPVDGRRPGPEQRRILDAYAEQAARAVLTALTYERERELVAELQALDAYKSQFISTLSHELKNPLTAIVAHLELLESAEHEPGVQRSLDAMGRGAGRLRRIVDDLMMLAKVGDSTQPLLAQPVDLDRVARDVVDLLSADAQRRGVALSIATPRQPAVALGDPMELDRLVANLVGNAVKYTQPGGTVTVSLLPTDEEVVLEVVDTGIGISSDDQEQLFTEFFRSGNPLAVAQPGTGLGLTIVHRIVARHGGRLHLASELGAGSTFRVVLPVARPQA